MRGYFRCTAYFLASIWLSGCASMQHPIDRLAVLEAYQALNIRLDEVVAPVLNGAADLCDKQELDIGAWAHDITHYPEDLRKTAEEEYSFDGTAKVAYVRQNGAAWANGIRAGDPATVLDGLTGETEICATNVKIRFSEDKNAYADGKGIIITSELLRSTDIDVLQLILAHELGHNVYGHVDEAHIPDHERQADRFALFVLARMGSDIDEVTNKEAALTPPGTSIDQFPIAVLNRAAGFRTVIDEINSLKQQGKALVP